MNAHPSSGNTQPARAFIALGANLGKPLDQLDSAVQALQGSPHITCIAMSKVYQSQPHGPQDQPDFTNAVLEIHTTLAPLDLLVFMQTIEKNLGRIRQRHWGERSIDLDLIVYDNIVMNTDILTIPHPLAHAREFVIKPLHDLDTELTIPNHGAITTLLKKLPTKNLREIRNGTTYHH